VHKDPPKWTGQTYAGAPFSDCPPDYLRILADLLVWRAGKADEEGRTTKGGKPQSEFLRKDAARALGWMQRNERKAAPRPKAKPTSLNDPAAAIAGLKVQDKFERAPDGGEGAASTVLEYKLADKNASLTALEKIHGMYREAEQTEGALNIHIHF
jgi:hypothetical protein